MYELKHIKTKANSWISTNEDLSCFYDDDGNSVSPAFRTAEIIYDNVIIFASGYDNQTDEYVGYGLYDMDSQEMLIKPEYSLIYYDPMTELIIKEWSVEKDDDDDDDDDDEGDNDDDDDDDDYHYTPKSRFELFVDVCNNRGQSLTEYAYDSVVLISNSYILTKTGKKYSLYNLKGKRILSGYHGIYPINASKKFILKNDSLYAKNKNKEYQSFSVNLRKNDFFPTEGKWCKSVTMCYRIEGTWACGADYLRSAKNLPLFAKIYSDGKYGVIDINANVCIPIEYDKITFHKNYIEGKIGKHEYVFNEEDFPVPSKRRIIDDIYNEPYYLFFDTETTGTILENEKHSRLVQIAWILCNKNLEILNKKTYIIKPDGFLIPKESIEVHGITNLKARRLGENIKRVLDAFLKDYEQCEYVVGHNINFDIKMMNYELLKNKYDIKLRDSYIDTMSESVEYCHLRTKNGKYKYPKLIELYTKLFGKAFDDAHDAMADIKATYKCFVKMKDMGLIER